MVPTKTESKQVFHHHHHHSVLPKGRSLTASAGTKAAVLPKAGLPPQTQAKGYSFIE